MFLFCFFFIDLQNITSNCPYKSIVSKFTADLFSVAITGLLLGSSNQKLKLCEWYDLREEKPRTNVPMD